MNTTYNLESWQEPTRYQLPGNDSRKTATLAGALYLLTFVSVPTLMLYGPIHDSNYLHAIQPDFTTVFGAMLEIIVALSGIATAIVLYPVLRKTNQPLAIGLIASRVLEAATIFVGVAFLLALVTLKLKGTFSQSGQISAVFTALYDRMFITGQGFLPAVDDLLLGILLYRSRLVPRALSVVGIVGAFTLVAGYLAIQFSVIDQRSLPAALSAIPVASFEFSFGLYLLIKGFRSPKL